MALWERGRASELELIPEPEPELEPQEVVQPLLLFPRWLLEQGLPALGPR